MAKKSAPGSASRRCPRPPVCYAADEPLRFTPDRGCGTYETDVVIDCPRCGHVATYYENFRLTGLKIIDGQAVTHIKCDACAGWIELLVDIHCRFPSLEAFQ